MKKREIYLAGGCFWGTQKYLDNVQGVLETEVGYANYWNCIMMLSIQLQSIGREGILEVNTVPVFTM